jgi:hypothetical protein
MKEDYKIRIERIYNKETLYMTMSLCGRGGRKKERKRKKEEEDVRSRQRRAAAEAKTGARPL